MKSNGWSPDTAALQLFAHLDGEALKVALLMPDKIRERWKDLVDELSAYSGETGGYSPAIIAAQQSCDLHRHLDGAAPEASIGDIVDSCRIWESHAEPIDMDNWSQGPVNSQPTLHKPPPATFGPARLQHRVGSVRLASNE